MTREEFAEKIKKNIITGHVGLLESMNMIAAGLGWELDDAVELPPEPVTADKEIKTGLGTVKPGEGHFRGRTTERSPLPVQSLKMSSILLLPVSSID